jgi:hypothetical protein
MKHVAGAVDHDVGDVVARQQAAPAGHSRARRCRCPRAVLLLGDRHGDVLDRDDLGDDVADFIARGFIVELAS